MPTTTKSRYSARKAFSDYYVYAPIGAGLVLVEKSKEAAGRAWKEAQKRRRQAVRSYQDLAERGEKLVASVRRSAYTGRAIDQAKAARSQVKGAVTSIRKSAGTTAQATRAAARKVG